MNAIRPEAWSQLRKTILESRYRQMCRQLAHARRAVELTQAELADRLGRPQSFVSKYETSERRLDVLELVEVCEALGIDPRVLVATLSKTATERKDAPDDVARRRASTTSKKRPN